MTYFLSFEHTKEKMLIRLQIANYALIDEVKISFPKGFSIITGETGSGKSILLDALGLLMGNRADTTVITDKEKKTVVEGVFDIHAYGLKDFFQENDLDYDAQSILRREINTAGKSRAFINDTPVNLQLLKDLSEKLIDIHAQHENIQINTQEFAYQLLASFGKFKHIEDDYQQVFKEWQGKKQTLNALIEQQRQLVVEQDYIRFQVNELSQAQIKEGEEERLEEDFKRLSHAGEIARQLFAAQQLLSDDDFAALSRIKESIHALQAVTRFAPELEELIKRLQSSAIELQDISDEAAALTDKFQSDPELLQRVSERLDFLQSLMQKHRVGDSKALMATLQHYQSRMDDADQLDNSIMSIQKEIAMLEQRLNEQAEQIFALREQSIPLLSKEVENTLHHLQMPDARFIVRHNKTTALHRFGIDQLQLLFSANKGMSPERLDKVASGGERSRVMLSIKKLLAASTALPTMIFDEIDAGVSGAVADAMGDILKEMSNSCQVFTITHLPQVAAKGDSHFKVMKLQQGASVRSQIIQLKPEERVMEIASMLSGKELTNAAMENARALINL
jgi:DNA repair protein RecN (Recombination protein N)